MKTCTKCHVEQSLDGYDKDVKGRNGLHAKCRTCRAAYRAANREKLTAKQVEYREVNREEILARDKAYREANRDAINQRKRDKRAAERRATDGLYTDD